MKKLISLFLILLMLSATAAFAAENIDLTTYTDEELEALKVQVAEEIRARKNARAASPAADFRYMSNGSEVRIVEYIGKGGNVIIPDTLDGAPVTQIGKDAFNEYYEVNILRSITLPAELASIGDYAFRSTYQLEQVLVLPGTLEKIGTGAFQNSNIHGVVVQSACELGTQAFDLGEKLQFCYIREGSAASLGIWAFRDTPVEVVVIPADVTNISGAAFTGCEKLTIYCPAGSYAEQYCKDNFIVCNTAEYENMAAYYEALYPAD